MKRTFRLAFALLFLVASGLAVADAGVARVVTYDDDAIRSRDCALEHAPHYYAVDGTGYIRLTCDSAPTVYPYGFAPPSMVGAIILRIHRTDTGETANQSGCGLLMLDGEDDGRLYLALDCRASAKRAAGRARSGSAN